MSFSFFFFGGGEGSFCSPYDPDPVLGNSSEGLRARISWRAVDRPACSRSAAMTGRAEERRRRRRCGGGGCKERGRGESEEWRRGEQRRAAAAASDPEGAASPPSSPPPLLCHSGLDYFILIRLIPPMEVSCSSPLPRPSNPSSRSSRQDQSPFSVKGRMRVPLRLIRREKCERWDWKEALTAAVRGARPGDLGLSGFDRLAGGASFV